MSIRPCRLGDLEAIGDVINAAAEAYRPVIPAECWHEPYMAAAQLRREVAAGVRFLGWEENDGLLAGVMGLQAVRDVALIRHAYVLPTRQRRGIGARLLDALLAGVDRPVLVGTWAAAEWAVSFYRCHGFADVDEAEKERLLRTYWTVPARQIANSVVLAAPAWRARDWPPFRPAGRRLANTR